MYKGFPSILLDSLVCQIDGERLAVKECDNYLNITNGLLRCVKCSSEYFIRNGVLDLINRSEISELMRSEMYTRDEQAHKYDARMDVRFAKEVIPTLRAVNANKNDMIIEYGCGTGRITIELLKKETNILAVDFSLKSLNILKSKIKHGNVGLVLADASSYKTSVGFFDKAVSFQVYEHLHSGHLKKTFLMNAENTLKKGGYMINTIYHYDLRKKIRKSAQEGLHRGKIYYHYYSVQEIKHEFGAFFSKNRIKYIDITLPLEARLRIASRLGGFISAISSKIPVLNRFAHLLLVESKKQ